MKQLLVTLLLLLTMTFSLFSKPIKVATRNVLGSVSVNNSQPFSQVVYLKNNWIDHTVDLNGNISRVEYDAAGRKVKTISAIGQETTVIYDKSGNVPLLKAKRENKTHKSRTEIPHRNGVLI